MTFDSFAAFLAMGGHGLYVWLGYGAGLAIVLGNVLALRLARRRYFREARALEQRRGAAGDGTPAASANPTLSRPEPLAGMERS